MVGERTVPAIAQTIVQGEARSPFERVVRVEGQTVIDGAPVGEAECRLLAEKTQAVAEHDLVLRVIKRVGVAAGSERIRVGKRPGCTVAASGDTRCQTEERSEYKLFDVVVLDAEAECVASEDGCAVIFGLFVVLEGPLGREEVRTNDHVVADANEDWLTAGINSSGSAGGGVRVHNEVVEVHIGEAYGMRPPAGAAIGADNMKIGVVQVRERVQSNSTKAGHSDVIIVLKAIEETQLLIHVPVQAPAADVFG